MDVKLKILLLLSLFSSACASNPERPALDIQIFYPSSASQSLERRAWQEPYKTVKASSKEFDSFIAMSQKDFARFVKTFVFGCKVWKKDPATDLTDEEVMVLEDIEKGEF